MREYQELALRLSFHLDRELAATEHLLTKLQEAIVNGQMERVHDKGNELRDQLRYIERILERIDEHADKDIQHEYDQNPPCSLLRRQAE